MEAVNKGVLNLSEMFQSKYAPYYPSTRGSPPLPAFEISPGHGGRAS